MLIMKGAFRETYLHGITAKDVSMLRDHSIVLADGHVDVVATGAADFETAEDTNTGVCALRW